MDREHIAISLMDAFAERTGVGGGRPANRYLWTDAFAVCTDLALYARRGETRFLRRACTLARQVHEVLGRYAESDRRRGPLGGASAMESLRHPTRYGLRIGKPLPERAADQPLDERLEWERDGQYFHYLTRWIHALERLARTLDDPEPHRWAVELCQASSAFIQRDANGRPQTMCWKMAIDLDRPLVASMGQHDALDGWVTAAELVASPLSRPDEREALRQSAAEFRALDDPHAWPTVDPLGIGGLLTAAARLWFDARDAHDRPVAVILQLLHAALAGLDTGALQRSIALPAAQRLAFRELGSCIGMHAVAAIDADRRCASPVPVDGLAAVLTALQAHAGSLRSIEACWSDPRHRASDSWHAHSDINDVMLAASLAPEVYRNVTIRA